jgi:PIN domain nuclease of toxin-antitoxin system
MILLDTQALEWAALDQQRLSRPAAAAIEAARQGDGVGIAPSRCGRSRCC